MGIQGSLPFAQETCRKARRQANGAIRYTAIVRNHLDIQIVHREAKTLSHRRSLHTGSGFMPVDAGLGTVPQFTPHGLVASQGFEPRLLAAGSTLYMVLVSKAPTGSPAPLTAIQLLQKLN